jgi:hypothetical protein
MTRNEIKALALGTRLELVDGSIVTVKGVDQEGGTIAFEYDITPLAAPAMAADAAMGGFMGPKIISADGAISATAPPVPPPATQAVLTTTVRCKWLELANAAKLNPSS